MDYKVSVANSVSYNISREEVVELIVADPFSHVWVCGFPLAREDYVNRDDGTCLYIELTLWSKKFTLLLGLESKDFFFLDQCTIYEWITTKIDSFFP